MKKNNLFTLFNLFLIIIGVLFFQIVFDNISNYNKENFTSSIPTYQKCINSGYSKEFCIQTPTSVLGPAGCLCRDGSVGRIIPGFRGKCFCGNDYF